MVKISFKGDKRLKKKLQTMQGKQEIKQVVRQNTAELQNKMMRNALFTRGYSTGATKRSISMDLEDGGLTGVVKPNTEYASYLEWGTRFMPAQKFVGPSFNQQKIIFIKDMEKLFK